MNCLHCNLTHLNWCILKDWLFKVLHLLQRKAYGVLGKSAYENK